MKDSPIKLKSYSFALRIVKVYQHFKKVHKEYVLSKQLLKSGTAVGALIREAEFAQSSADFISKLHIALKEANETMYWISIPIPYGIENPIILHWLLNTASINEQRVF